MKNLLINLDYQCRIPIYEQIVNNVERFVALGIIKENEQIPSIRDMASAIGVNPNTVKKAYDILENRGIIQTISTKGTFISSDTRKATNEKIDREINSIMNKINELIKMGVDLDYIINKIKNKDN